MSKLRKIKEYFGRLGNFFKTNLKNNPYIKIKKLKRDEILLVSIPESFSQLQFERVLKDFSKAIKSESGVIMLPLVPIKIFKIKKDLKGILITKGEKVARIA